MELMLKWSGNVVLHPWVGSGYKDGYAIGNRRIRLLILGESHYRDMSDGRNQEVLFTQQSIKSYLGLPSRRWPPSPYWTKIGRVIAGCERYNDRLAFWESIAFYNYIQCFQDIGKDPSGDAYKTSSTAFEEILQGLKPEAIIVFSQRLWGRIKDIVGDRGIGINHPRSRGFKYCRWHPEIEKKLGGMISGKCL
jgi:hypothetical protein